MSDTDPTPVPLSVRTEFYHTGGTIPVNAPSYVERQSDHELYRALTRGEYCYMLTSRQMGKSSTMIRIAARLRQDGLKVAILDLTAVGQNLSPEQWYGALIRRLGRQIDLEDELEDYWDEQDQRGPLERWMGALEDVVLPALQDASLLSRGQGRRVNGGGKNAAPPSLPGDKAPATAQPVEKAASLVIFIDEIDAVRSLPFPSDEFFSAIRECYNRRVQDERYHQITFCLLGAATPADLIQNARTSPFNIGTRIELRDFTLEEAAPLELGFQRNSTVGEPALESGYPHALLRRILYWTGGQPFLTQRLARAVSEEITLAATSQQPCPEGTRPTTQRPNNPTTQRPNNPTTQRPNNPTTQRPNNPTTQRPNDPPTQSPSSLVDRLCEDLFLTHKAREVDDNLNFVRSRLLRSEVDLAGLLDLYMRIRRSTPLSSNSWQRLASRLAPENWGTDGSVRDDEANPLIRVLKLSGLVKVEEGTLRVRNRIYNQVFNREWVNETMPNAELRRQKAAYWRGVLLTAAVSLGMLTLTSVLYGMAVYSRHVAEQETKVAVAAENHATAAAALALQAQDRTRRLLYDSSMELAAHASQRGDMADVRLILNGQRGKPDLRGFEWAYQWQLLNGGAQRLRGHQGPADAAWAPDGSLVTVDTDSILRRWRPGVNQPEAVRDLKRFGIDFVLALSEDGRRLAARVQDGGVALVDVAEPGSRRLLRGIDVNTLSAAFSHGSKLLLTMGFGPTIRIWSSDTGALLRSFTPRRTQGADSDVLAASDLGENGTVALSYQGSTSEAAVIGCYRPGSDAPVLLTGVVGSIDALAVSVDGKRVAAAGSDGALMVWKVDSQGFEWKLPPGSWSTTSLAFSPDGRILGAGGDDGSLRVLDGHSGKLIQKLMGHSAPIASLLFSPDHKMLASSSAEGVVRLSDLERDEDHPTFATNANYASGLIYTLDGSSLVFVGTDSETAADGSEKDSGDLRILNARTGQIERQLIDPDGFGSAVLSPNGRWLVTGGDLRSVVKIRQPDTGAILAVLPGLPGNAGHPEQQTVGALAFSPDSRLLAVGFGHRDWWLASYGQVVQIWDMAAHRLVATLRGYRNSVSGLSFSPDGKLLVTGCYDGAVRIWTVGAWTLARNLDSSHDPISCTCLSRDGNTLAAGSAEGSISVWDLSNGNIRFRMQGHSSNVTSVSLCPDGRTLASSSRDNTIKLWDLTTGQETSTLRGHTDRVQVVAFSPDGLTLASAGKDRRILLWKAIPIHDADVADTIRLAAAAPDAKQLLQTAETLARSEHKRVLLVIDDLARWSAQRLLGLFHHPQVRSLFDSNYVLVVVAASSQSSTVPYENPGARDLLASLGQTVDSIPYLAVLDPDGKLLADSMEQEGKWVFYPHAPNEVEHYVQMIKVTALCALPAQLDAWRKLLEQAEK